MQDEQKKEAKRFSFRKIWPVISETFWISCGILLPLAAILTEKFTEICARTFFDPTPTDWHLLLIALVPLTNLVGELFRIKGFAERFAWLNSPVTRWINGVAIGIAGFYAIWFLPIAILFSIILCAGMGSSIIAIVLCPFMIIASFFAHPHDYWKELTASFWILPFGSIFWSMVCALPLAPLMSCFACLRTRALLFSLKQDATPDTASVATKQSGRRLVVNKLNLAIGLISQTIAFGLLARYWYPYVTAKSTLAIDILMRQDFLAIWGPPLLILLGLVLPTPISPIRWFAFTDKPARPAKPYLRRLFLPVACGLLLLLAIEIPSTATRVAMILMEMPGHRAEGLLLLRAFGNDDAMLRMCYEKSHATDILGCILTVGRPVSKETARENYYLATGRPFNSRNIPAAFRGKWRDFESWSWGDEDDVFDSDADLAGETVGGVVRGVSLEGSQMVGDIDAKGSAASINWDMQFKNDSKFQREARAQILLPPHAVVSNVFLWINGKPCPAAFGSRSTTRAAYRAVVRSKRDPLLVTTCGPDRILAQCFPVPPKGTMHIQLGITSPLLVNSDSKAYLTLPVFLERNFQVRNHTVQLKSNGTISSADQSLKPDKQWTLAGTIDNADLSQGKATILVERKSSGDITWHRDSVEDGKYILQSISKVPCQKPRQLVVVVDGSAAMAQNAKTIADVLKKIPSGIKLTLLRAGDEVEEIANGLNDVSTPVWAQALQTLECQTFVGGQDDSLALLRALRTLDKEEQSAILWLHGPQPVRVQYPYSDNLVEVRYLLDENPSNVLLYELQMENGPNKTIEALDGSPNIRRLPVISSPVASLEHLFSLWSTGAQAFESVLTQADAPPKDSHAQESQIDLSPLWAAQSIDKLRKTSRHIDKARAVAIAKAYRVVTPVSGAVVLETRKDYQKFGLKDPSAPNHSSKAATAPNAATSNVQPSSEPASTEQLTAHADANFNEFAAPEPHDWLIFLSAMVFFILAKRQRWLRLQLHEN